MSRSEAAGTARGGYRRRVAARARRARAETATLRLERERLLLAQALRRELQALAQGAGELARTARGGGRAAELAQVRLSERRRRAQEVLVPVERFGLEVGLAELETGDRTALGLGDA